MPVVLNPYPAGGGVPSRTTFVFCGAGVSAIRYLSSECQTHVGTDREPEHRGLEEQDHEEVRPPDDVDDRGDRGAPAIAVLRHPRPSDTDQSLEAVLQDRRRARDGVRVRELPVEHAVGGASLGCVTWDHER